jgi:hypothetical protein
MAESRHFPIGKAPARARERDISGLNIRAANGAKCL